MSHSVLIEVTEVPLGHYPGQNYLSSNVADHPLRSATDRRLGKPLPYQLANQTRVHPIPPEL